jgi:transforming growth factor-beta-induced protein
MKKYFKLPVLLSLLVGFAFYSCSDDDEDQIVASKTIVDVASENADFSILVEAVTKAGLANALSNKNASLTVFAPTNGAFASLLDELGATSLEDIPNDVLTSVLLYHVLGEQKTSDQLLDGYYSTLSAGPTENLNLTLYKDG